MLKAVVWKAPADSPHCPGLWCVRLPGDPNMYTAPDIADAMQFARRAIGLKRIVHAALQRTLEERIGEQFDALPDHIKNSTTIH